VVFVDKLALYRALSNAKKDDREVNFQGFLKIKR